MNLIDLSVTEVLSEPYQINDDSLIDEEKYWFVDVMANGYGHISQSTVMVKTREEALNIKPGYIFQA